jgi:hypothetical protein
MKTVRSHKSFSKSFKWHFKGHGFGAGIELFKQKM